MLIEANKVVSLHYRFSEAGHDVVEDRRGGAPVVYLHGHRGMLKGLEDALAGKKAGDTFNRHTVTGTGVWSAAEDSVQRISIKHLINPGKKKIHYKPGMMVQVNTAEGPRNVVVVKAGLKTVDIDTNHPLAGKTLVFDIEVVDVRDATAEEIAHGHVHGEGGHHH